MKRITILFLGMFLATSTMFAQNVQITGTVTSSEDGLPLPGVSVVQKGTTVGTTTDIDGKYVLSVPSDAQTLVFSFIGMKSQDVAIAGQSTIDVILSQDVLGLEEIFVVAYGVQRREAKTGSVGVVSSDELQDVPETSIDKMLAGKVAGVVVSQSTGQPGSNSDVRIRGNSSINAGKQPLYVIDGVAVMSGNQSYFTNSGNALAALNPNDVESISILKDAAAASIYGSRAANGVILITTKSGKSGTSKINFSTSAGFETIANDNDYWTMPYDDYITYLRDAVVNAGLDPDDSSNSTYYFPESLRDEEYTDWLDLLLRKGRIFNAELSASGGNEKTSNFFSGSYSSNEGIAYGIEYEKYQFRSNIDHQLKDNLKIGTRINGAHTYQQDVAMQSLYYVNPLFAGMLLSPFTPVKNEDGTYNTAISYWSYSNPAATAAYDDQWEKQNRFNGSIYLEWEPIKGLVAKTTNSYEYTGGEGRRYWSPEADGTTDMGVLQTSSTKREQLTTSNTLTYTNTFDVHNFSFTAGQEAMHYAYNLYFVYADNIDPDIPYLSTASSADDESDYEESAYSLLSYFGVLYYNFDNKYYLQGSLRTDGCSRFGSNTRWGNFWSVGASWNIHNEAFAENLGFLNQAKLRLSYGKNGNNNIGNYEQYGTYGTEEYNGNVFYAPSNPENADLGWETNVELNVGLDFAVFDKFSGSFDLYTRTTKDMLLDYPLSYTSGYSSITTNIGELLNQGFEFLLNYSVISTRDLKFDIAFNIAHNSSEILDLGKDEQFVNDDNGRILHKVGEHLYSFYLKEYAGVNPANGEALWWTNDGEDGGKGVLTNTYSDAEKIIAGSPEPKFTGGINPSIYYKGISLDVNLEFKTGNKILVEENRYMNSDGNFWGKNVANTALDYWKEPGDITENPKPIAYNSSYSYYYYNTRWMFDGDYLRVKNITLSYNLPKSVTNSMKVQNVRFYASAVNLYTFHKVDYWDPERGVDGTGFGIYPLSKKFLFGVELSF